MLLQIRDLSIHYHSKPIVEKLNLLVGKQQIAVIVGESGSGKSTVLRSILGLLGEGGRMTGGEILFEGLNLAALHPRELRTIRGSEISVIFQNPEAFFDPRMRIGHQFYETMKVHRKVTKTQAFQTAVSLLTDLQFANPLRVLNSYPYELSGGMCQRVAIGMAVANQPRLILADEPTSALDVTVQAEIIDLLLRLQKQHRMSMLLVTHNMAVVDKMADVVGVMYQGELVEWGTRQEVLSAAKHPYTQTLLQSVPRFNGKPSDV
jgi:ABC-type dipeptide/oligopeptide/nickel transport system ATPase component